MQTGPRRDLEVEIDDASLADASGIASVHVAVWRNAYSGILPDRALVDLSVPRMAGYYTAAIRRHAGALVARAPDARVVGFSTFSRLRHGARAPAEGEVETLYVHDDWREHGIGRALLAEAARRLREVGCRSLFLNVLADNGSRWFYEHLGGRPSLRSVARVGGVEMPQIAMVWDRIGLLADLA